LRRRRAMLHHVGRHVRTTGHYSLPPAPRSASTPGRWPTTRVSSSNRARVAA
jgi:hypothetical protein